MTGTIKPPDFDTMMELAENIRDLTLKELVLKNEIKQRESEIVMEVTTNPTYYKDGKIPAMNFIEATYKVNGINGELAESRNTLANVSAELDFCKRKFDILKDMLNAWQTESANLRASTI